MLSIVTPSIDQLSRIIATVAAPAFLLGAVASFISVLVGRINRVVDRAQFLHAIPGDHESKAHLKADLPRLKRRAALLNRALICAVISSIFTGLIIIVAFISAWFSMAHEYGVALLFIGALLLFCSSLIDLVREARISLHDSDLQA
ncbi:DUF2721 domain-containing protein [Bradyrhizobium tropiciagri]|uniref:DUF2721 domain-containing protein n=1 Tax=Bradyrhizobium tropiciagri TaxID=312253 RepID=UPI001BAE05E8|nr:DUF2721 domain-containing protein [Bradyrhizobium tropiciagri]MBR0871241.1 DUF2721 domain-containing protein [Bradyrhizobium tropiciagri]